MAESSKLSFLVSGECRGDMGQLEDVLNSAVQPFEFVKRWPPPGVEFDRERHCGLIILGDGNYWATSKKYAHDRALLAAALEAKRGVLGICFGAQLLVAHLSGITNGRSLGKPPCGDHGGNLAQVVFRGEGLTDPVMAALREHPLATMSHEDCFQAPVVTGLAWSADSAVEHCEAFRVGPPTDAIYGLQFHPEPTLAMLQDVRDGLRWFNPLPSTEKLSEVVVTGRRILEAWLKLAMNR